MNRHMTFMDMLKAENADMRFEFTEPLLNSDGSIRGLWPVQSIWQDADIFAYTLNNAALRGHELSLEEATMVLEILERRQSAILRTYTCGATEDDGTYVHKKGDYNDEVAAPFKGYMHGVLPAFFSEDDVLIGESDQIFEEGFWIKYPGAKRLVDQAKEIVQPQPTQNEESVCQV